MSPKSIMPSPNDLRQLYQAQFNSAFNLFRSGDLKGSLSAATTNIAEPALPPYYRIWNYLLIGFSLDDWNAVDPWLLAAERAYERYASDVVMEDEQSLEDLQFLRQTLDSLAESRLED
ncbi:hypothetical protein M011DRAFT_420822, partial [Sporormia fimetaria CBS 119925]